MGGALRERLAPAVLHHRVGHDHSAMRITNANQLADSRGHYPIGRIRAASDWRPHDASRARADRLTAVRKLIREAEEYGADAIIELEFHLDDVKRAEIEGASLVRIAATGIAVRFVGAGCQHGGAPREMNLWTR